MKHFRAEVLNGNDAMRALLQELDRDLEPLAVDGGTATYDIALPEIAAHEACRDHFSIFSRRQHAASSCGCDSCGTAADSRGASAG